MCFAVLSISSKQSVASKFPIIIVQRETLSRTRGMNTSMTKVSELKCHGRQLHVGLSTVSKKLGLLTDCDDALVKSHPEISIIAKSTLKRANFTP